MELLDINGMYMLDNSIFDNMVIPSDINRSELIDMIIYECRELTLSMTSTRILKRAIELWSKKNIYYWNELQKTMHYDYNPIENYDRYELTTDNYKNNGASHETGNRTTKQNGTNTTTETGSRTRVDSGSKTVEQSGTKTTTDELTVSAFNSSTLEPRETHTITETPSNWITTETPNDYTVTETPNVTTETTPDLTTVDTPNLTTTDNNTGENKRESYVHGNIGVMSTQQMITAQREVIDISLYTLIVNSFKNEFCILKY